MNAVGCLLINDFTVGKKDASGRSLFHGALSRLFHASARDEERTQTGPGRGLSLELDGVDARPFDCRDSGLLWPELQIAHQRVRAGYAHAGIAAVGTGCAAALALSEQLPVERMALVFPERAGKRAAEGEEAALSRQVYRLEQYALRNLPLCVCDILLIRRPSDAYARALCFGGLCANSRVISLAVEYENGLKFVEDRQKSLNLAISCFLRTGELPKSLAENPEMCIIYG